MRATRTVVEARAFPWERSLDSWGVAVRYANGERRAYQVGTRTAAEQEVARLTQMPKLVQRPQRAD